MNNSKQYHIKIIFENTTLTAVLGDNPTSRDFISLLPLQITLNDYAETEKISHLPKKLSTDESPAGFNPSVGDITYYAPWGNLAIFYKDFGFANGLIKLGSIDNNIEVFKKNKSLQVKIELCEQKPETNKFNKKENIMDKVNIQFKEELFSDGVKAPNEVFTGNVWVKMLVTDEDNVYNTQAYNVMFEASARTNWHSHPGGQLLFVTKGTGYYQEKGQPAHLLKPGDVVEIPPNINHWHGAAPNSDFIHLGVSTRTQDGPADWNPAVTDEEYAEATK